MFFFGVVSSLEDLIQTMDISSDDSMDEDEV